MTNTSGSDSREVLTAIASIQQDIKYMSKQIDAVTTISEKTIRNEESIKVAHNRIKDTNDEIDQVKDSLTWTWRAIGGSIIVIVVDKLFL